MGIQLGFMFLLLVCRKFNNGPAYEEDVNGAKCKLSMKQTILESI
jgi:hypothetical protein